MKKKFVDGLARQKVSGAVTCGGTWRDASILSRVYTLLNQTLGCISGPGPRLALAPCLDVIELSSVSFLLPPTSPSHAQPRPAQVRLAHAPPHTRSSTDASLLPALSLALLLAPIAGDTSTGPLPSAAACHSGYRAAMATRAKRVGYDMIVSSRSSASITQL